MNRLNGERLKYISNSMQDVIRDLDEIVLYKTLSKFRNDTAHVYKKPPFKVLLQFYKENRDFLINTIENINGVIKR